MKVDSPKRFLLADPLPLRPFAQRAGTRSTRSPSPSVRQPLFRPVLKERSQSYRSPENVRRKHSIDLFFARFRELAKELSLVKRQNESLKKKYVQIEVEMHGETTGAAEVIREKEKQAESLRKELTHIGEENAAQQHRCETLRQDYAKLQRVSSTKLSSVFDQLHEKVSVADLRLATLEEEGSKLTKSMAGLKRRADKFDSENDTLSEGIVRAIDDATKNKADIESRLGAAEERIKTQAPSLESLRSKVEEATKQSAQLVAERKMIKLQIREHEKLMEELTRRKDECCHRREVSHEVNSVREQENVALRSICDKVSNTLKQIKENKSQAKVKHSVLDQCKYLVNLCHVKPVEDNSGDRANCRRRRRKWRR